MAKWIIDPDHSVGSFSIRHLTVAFVHGQLNKVSGTINFDPDDAASMVVEFEIDADSIITGIGKRDDHLKSADFFDIEKYPKITYKSTKSERTGYNSFKVRGDLTIHGIKKSIAIEMNVLGPVKSPFGETTIGLTGKTVLNREDFGIKWNEPMEKGGFMVGKEARVTMNIEADLKED
jgi:polyisoprenoid-binding protein YceI